MGKDTFIRNLCSVVFVFVGDVGRCCLQFKGREKMKRQLTINNRIKLKSELIMKHVI